MQENHYYKCEAFLKEYKKKLISACKKHKQIDMNKIDVRVFRDESNIWAMICIKGTGASIMIDKHSVYCENFRYFKYYENTDKKTQKMLEFIEDNLETIFENV